MRAAGILFTLGSAIWLIEASNTGEFAAGLCFLAGSIITARNA
jgi:hypothetical protein